MSGPGSRDLVLAGPPGAGKTAAGQIAALLLGRAFSDLDALIEKEQGATISSLFSRGQPVFRAAERDAAASWFERRGAREPEVLALGGGTLTDPALADAFAARTTLVRLDAPAEELARRLDASARASRPLLAGASDPAAGLARLVREREAGYARASLRIDARGPDAACTAHRLLRALYDPPAGPWNEPSGPLADGLACARGVTIGRGPGPVPRDRPLLLFVDDGLPDVHAASLRAALGGPSGAPREHRVPGGERAKRPEELVRAWRALLEARADRALMLEVAGGGAVTDLGGFVAATFKRGLPVTLRPTTLLGQLDAALGGKNAIDLDGVKNVAGTVRLPGAVHIDTLTLMTLPVRALRCGLAEAIKCAVIGDPGLLDEIEEHADAFAGTGPVALPLLERIVRRAARVKLDVVERDLHEEGPRRVLNLGHTAGHALETAAAEQGIDLEHGEAVAIGLVAATRVAARSGTLAERDLEQRLASLIARAGLPIEAPPLGPGAREALLRALAQDKKSREGAVAWALPRRAGDVVLETPAPAHVEPVIKELCR